VAIDFTLSDSQQELQTNARAFAEGVLQPIVEGIDRAADGWESFLAGREAYREMARAGFTKSFIPAEYGGAGFSMLTSRLPRRSSRGSMSTSRRRCWDPGLGCSP